MINEHSLALDKEIREALLMHLKEITYLQSQMGAVVDHYNCERTLKLEQALQTYNTLNSFWLELKDLRGKAQQNEIIFKNFEEELI